MPRSDACDALVTNQEIHEIRHRLGRSEVARVSIQAGSVSVGQWAVVARPTHSTPCRIPVPHLSASYETGPEVTTESGSNH